METEDWISYILEMANQYYAGRQVVLWGAYSVSELMEEKLKERYGIKVSFYVDGDIGKVDNVKVFSPDCLDGRPSEYYVIIPIGFYQSVKDKLDLGGYKEETDYYYFCDCIIHDDGNFYEDSHGNKITGNYSGTKIVFSGFNSQITIGENVRFSNITMYIHSGCSIHIGDNSSIKDSDFCIGNCELDVVSSSNADTVLEIEKQCCIQYLTMITSKYSVVRMGEAGNYEGDISNNVYWKVGQESKLKIGYGCSFRCGHIVVQRNANALIGDSCVFYNSEINMENDAYMLIGAETKMQTGVYCKVDCRVQQGGTLKIGSRCIFSNGQIFVWKNAVISIGKNFSIEKGYGLHALPHTNILIGDDCMFSWEIQLLSSDAHSIFDVITGEKINTVKNLSEKRKIEIGNHVWIGMRVTILYNTKIYDGSIIGACSVVKGIISNNCIAAGLSARIIRENIAWCRDAEAEDIAEVEPQYINYTISE